MPWPPLCQGDLQDRVLVTANLDELTILLPSAGGKEDGQEEGPQTWRTFRLVNGQCVGEVSP